MLCVPVEGFLVFLLIYNDDKMYLACLLPQRELTGTGSRVKNWIENRDRAPEEKKGMRRISKRERNR